MKILIVDDSSVARRMLIKCIPSENIEIHEAGNGQEGIEKFSEIKPDLTFMDLTMPDMDGFEAIAEIRRRFGEPAIVVMSADVQKRSLERVRDLGVMDFLKKPARPEPVREVLARFQDIPAGAPPCEIVHADEKDVLQEIMNIAFGNAAADLAEVIDIYLDLSTPLIHILNVGDMADYLKNKISMDGSGTCIIRQNFWGDFSGFGILFLPDNAGRSLLMILEESEPDDETDEKPMFSQEREVLLEIGNILIGACVGKVCELLKTFVTYNPPQFAGDEGCNYSAFINSFDPSQAAIIMETVFRFDEVDIKGQLLIITHQDAILWLRKALHKFMESYT